MREDHCRRIESQGFLDHLARVHRCTVDAASEQFGLLDEPVLAVEKQCRKNFMLKGGQLGVQIVLDRIR